MITQLLSILIQIIHLIFITFILFAPFSNHVNLLFIHIIFSISMMTHWITNNDICALTIVESGIRGIDYKRSFIHQIVNPIYKISDNDLQTPIWVSTLILFFISSWRFYNHPLRALFIQQLKRLFLNPIM